MTKLLAIAVIGLFQPATAAPADTAWGAIEGRVWSEQGGVPLSHAFVQVFVEGRPLITVADADGRYLLHAVPPGRRVVRAFALDHAPFQLSVEVPGGGRVSVDLSLAVRPVQLPALSAVVHARRAGPGVPQAEAANRARELREAELRALEATPGMAELGLGRGEAVAPGPEPPDPSSTLYVRGATSDLKLVLLDGAPVYAPFHLGGLMDAVQADVFASSRLYVGGAPPRYDGGLSYVLEMETRRGDAERVRSSGAVDFLGARLHTEGPSGPVRYLASGRALHGGGYGALTGGSALPYGYGEGLVRLDAGQAEGPAVSATGFWNRETVSLDEASGFRGPARWGNAAGSLRYRSPAADGRLEVTAATGRFHTRLPVGRDTLRVAEGASQRSRLAVDFSAPSGPMRLAVGGSFDHHYSEVRWIAIASEDSVPAPGRGTGQVLGGYAEGRWEALSDLEVRVGLRSDLFLPATEMRLAPRLAAAWTLAEGTTLSVAAGRFNQYVRAPETILASDLEGVGFEEPGDVAVEDPRRPADAAGTLRVAGASHLVVGLENRLDESLDLGIEAYVKAFDGLPGTASLHTSGADVWVQRQGEPVSGWLGYSLAWVWTQPEDTGPLPGREGQVVGRHLVTGGLDTELLNGLDIGVRMAYGAGLPFTSIPTRGAAPAGSEGVAAFRSVDPPEVTSPLAGAPQGSYLRLDASVRRSWEARIHGQPVAITPYFRLLNALDRRDALFFFLDPQRDLRPTSVAAVPLLPVVGIQWGL